MSGTTEQNPELEEQPQVETPAPAVEAPPEPETPPPPAPPPEPPKQQEPDWRDRRIATLTRRLREMQEKQPQQQQQQPTQENWTQQQVENRARELASINDFNRRCDETAYQGRSQYGEVEFNGRINNLQKLVDQSDPASVQAYNSLLLAAIDTGEGAKVLHALGADLNEAQRILSLQPTRMAVELTKRAVAPTPELSTAPKPITPVGGRGAPHERISPDDPDRSDHLSTAEWMRRRETQLNERRQR